MDALGGASLVLRHFEMANLTAIVQPTCYGKFACGGAVFVSGGGNLTAEHGLFRGNTAGDGADGGAIKVMTGKGAVGAGAVALRFLTFRGNRAFFGGAVNIQGCSTGMCAARSLLPNPPQALHPLCISSNCAIHLPPP